MFATSNAYTKSVASFSSSIGGNTTYQPGYSNIQTQDIELDDRTRLVESPNLGTKRSPRRPPPTKWYTRLWYNTIDDIKGIPWLWMLRRFCALILPPASIIVVSIITAALILGRIWDGIQRPNSLCDLDGKFSLSIAGTYTPWRSSSLFSINLPIDGGFQFGIAKLIDIIWDIVVGRGFQVLLGIISYAVFTKAIVRVMEASSISQATFSAVTLQENTAYGVAILMRNFFSNKSIRARITIFWMIICTIFILLTPTWLSAMTGYTADVRAYVQDQTGNYVPPETFLPVVYIVWDSTRASIGERPLTVTTNWTKNSMPQLSAFGSSQTTGYLGCPPSYNPAKFNGSKEKLEFIPGDTKYMCDYMWRISNYTSKYGFRPGQQINSTYWTNYTFYNSSLTIAKGGTLNISAYFYYDDDSKHKTISLNSTSSKTSSTWGRDAPWHQVPYGYWYSEDGNKTFPFRTNNPLYYHRASNTTYSLTELNRNGVCQQTNNVEYKWGFSLLLTSIYGGSLVIWMIVMWSIYLDAYLNSRLDANYRHLGVERAVLDLSTAMRKKLDGQEVRLCDNKEIQNLVRQTQLSYDDLPLDSLMPTRAMELSQWWKAFRFWPWAKSERWWLSALGVFTLLGALSFVTSVGYVWWMWFSPFPIIGVLLVICMGRSVRSRWLVFTLWFLVFFALDIYYIATHGLKHRRRH